MSGHSRWSQIKRKKGKTDVQRGKVFSKILREVTVAARNGGGDPKANMRLKAAIEAARAANLPSENLKRAIQKFIEDPLLEKILMGDFARGDEIEVEVAPDGTKLGFRVLTSTTKA